MFKLVIFTSCCKIQETEAEAVRFGLRNPTIIQSFCDF